MTQAQTMLEPCPLCKGEAEYSEPHEGVRNAVHPIAKINCTVCGLTIKRTSKSDVVTAWNTRATTAAAQPVAWQQRAFDIYESYVRRGQTATPEQRMEVMGVVLRALGREHDAIYVRGWNEGIERAAELLEDEGSGLPAEKIRKLIDAALPAPQTDGADIGPYKGPMTIDAGLLHALWCYGVLNPVRNVVYGHGTHQKCLDDTDKLFYERSVALTRPNRDTAAKEGGS